MKVISNNACKTILTSNSSLDDSGTMKRNLDKALANGINYGLLCTQGKINENKEKLLSLILRFSGIRNGDGVFSGPCRGDDGGPLTIEEQGVTKLIGVVSGGIGCGTGVPSWYTKVSHSDRTELITRRGVDKVKPEVWFRYSL